TVDLVTGMSEDIKQNKKNYHASTVRGPKMKDDTSFLLCKDSFYIIDTEPFEKDKVKTRPLISLQSDSSMKALFDNWLYYHQGTFNPIKKINVDQIETCKQFMMEGIGMAILPKSVAGSLVD